MGFIHFMNLASAWIHLVGLSYLTFYHRATPQSSQRYIHKQSVRVIQRRQYCLLMHELLQLQRVIFFLFLHEAVSLWTVFKFQIHNYYPVKILVICVYMIFFSTVHMVVVLSGVCGCALWMWSYICIMVAEHTAALSVFCFVLFCFCLNGSKHDARITCLPFTKICQSVHNSIGEG